MPTPASAPKAASSIALALANPCPYDPSPNQSPGIQVQR